MGPSHRTDSSRLWALTDLLRRAVKPPSEAELRHGLNALKGRMVRTRSPWTPSWTMVGALAFSGFVLALLGVSYLAKDWNRSDRSIVMDEIEGGELLDGGYLSELGHSGIDLSFNDGSKFRLSPGTRGRLRELNSAGAHLALEHGTASFQITASPDHRWSVEAGPFVVTVRGTDFAVDWDPTLQELEVSLRHGRVAISGPVVGDELLLRPGQILTVSLLKRETVIKEARASSRSPSAKSEAEGIASEAFEARTSPSASAGMSHQAPDAALPRASASSAPRSELSWREAMATGQWDSILADIDRDGLKTLGTLSSEDLLALADAARYRRRIDLARAALLEQRRRFPGSPRSLDALFLLGRVEEAGQRRVAIQRYDEYLARAPGGTYAAEALGRRMILTKDVEGAASAARIAQEYLRRFPSGSYAKAARALRQIP